MRLLIPLKTRDGEIGTRFILRPRRRWEVYEISRYGDRLIGRTWRFRKAERWL